MHARDLTKVLKGSNRAHEHLVDAMLEYCELRGVPAIPIHTGARIAPRPGGGFDLRKNTRQIGTGDVLACLPPFGRLAFFEGKTGNAQRSREQRKNRDRFEAAGALCVDVRQVSDLEPYMPGADRTNSARMGTQLHVAPKRFKPQGGTR